ncbi:MAG: c-type cytochrome, partial [Saprospiraceae bacterium]|nr:c-type cytochrome [Saprospiraceae bacterium]
DTEEERTRAMAEITTNPFPITADGLDRGKQLYVVYCGICHGDKGDGAGYLVREDGGVYPAQPANFLLPDFVSSSEGRYYYAIMYGKNVMGGYSDKLSYEERWEVIHYIRSLQAKEAKKEYSETKNTFNNSIPGALTEGQMAQMEEESMMEEHADGMQMEHDQQH